MLPRTQKAIENGVVSQVDSVLAETGFQEVSKKEVQNSAREVLNANGASVPDVLCNMINLMNFAENEAVRMKAIENSLAIHGVDVKNTESGNKTQVNILISGENGSQTRLDQVLCPSDR